MNQKLLLLSTLLVFCVLFPRSAATQEPTAAAVPGRSILFDAKPVFPGDSARHGLLQPRLLDEQRLSNGGRPFWLFPAIGAGLGAATLMVVVLSGDGDSMGGIPFVVFSGGVGALMGGIVGLGVEVFVRAAEG